MLNFSCSYLPNKVFKSLEELLLHIEPGRTCLVFDTNVVIFYRDFYLNPRQFLESHKGKESIHVVRYLMEQIMRYDLKVIASLGVDESSRNKADFSLNKEKQTQTHNALTFLLDLHFENYEDFLRLKQPEAPIKSDGVLPPTMLGYLSQDCFYRHHLIISYLLCLKMILLKSKVDQKEASNSEAFFDLCRFMREEIDCVPATIQLYALHLFGGAENFKNIVFPNRNKEVNSRLRSIMNGAIDLVFPTLVNIIANYQYSEVVQNLVPVFVSTDKRLGTLHSLMSTKLMFSSKKEVEYYPELVQTEFIQKLNWTEEDYSKFDELTTSDIQNRFNKSLGKPRKSYHLLGLVKETEEEYKCW